ncbi:DnaJ domain containing protein [Klebsormidium nitens]|uniref:DnaJ domain containing protein n=1 Tax=Klebsormidium nitens TaxID=105231 RepID=A0A1Y1HRK3_KLENI|nr:DnaJ domain containing protein [Klebsormidium nitens]|eukprot:GAQ79197.1 DnaJ domain containing protein [Klebsormidium nitens]
MAAVARKLCRGDLLSSTTSQRLQCDPQRVTQLASPARSFFGDSKRALLPPTLGKQRSHRVSATRRGSVQCSVAGAAPGGAAEEEDPYAVLGVSRLASSDDIMSARRRRVKDAERRGDTAAQERLEKAYDSIMYGQLNKRASGIAFGNVEVSKDIKYADRQPLTPKWWPKKAPVDRKNTLINAAVAGILIISTAGMKYPNADKLPLVLVAMILRLYFKLGEFYPYEEEDREEKANARNQLLLRVLGLSFGTFGVAGLLSSLAASALAFPPAIVVNTVVVATVFYVVSFLR